MKLENKCDDKKVPESPIKKFVKKCPKYDLRSINNKTVVHLAIFLLFAPLVCLIDLFFLNNGNYYLNIQLKFTYSSDSSSRVTVLSKPFYPSTIILYFTHYACFNNQVIIFKRMRKLTPIQICYLDAYGSL